MVVLDERSSLSGMNLFEWVKFIRSELSDDILISAVTAIALIDIGRYTLITAGWFKDLVDRNIESHQEKFRAEGRVEGRAEGVAEGVEKVLSVLGEEARKDAERKLNLNGNPDSKD